MFDLLSPTESIHVDVEGSDVSTDGPGDQPHQGNGDYVCVVSKQIYHSYPFPCDSIHDLLLYMSSAASCGLL